MVESPSRRLLKFNLLGAAQSGKTSLLSRFCNNTFLPRYRATIGADFQWKAILIGEKTVDMQIWDTAVQVRFQRLGVVFCRGSDCCLIVFDITDAASFAEVDKWRQEFLVQGNPPNPETFPFLLVGNKADRDEERQVTWSEAEAWARNHSMPYFETSAKEDRNVKELFEEAARLALAVNPTD